MLKAIDHINIVVMDMERMLGFYRDILGLDPIRRVTIEGPWIEQVVGLAHVKAQVVYLQFPKGPRLELICYDHPQGVCAAGQDQPNTPGLRHLAFEVDNLDKVVAHLESRGVSFTSQVMQVPDSQVTYEQGLRKHLVYFHDPEKNLLELCEYRAAD